MPNAKEVGAELNRIAEADLSNDVKLFAIMGGSSLRRSAAAEFAKTVQAKYPILFDATNELAESLKPTHLPEAILLNAKFEIVYRGRIDQSDDNTPAKRYLFDVMSALHEGRAIATPRTESAGIRLFI